MSDVKEKDLVESEAERAVVLQRSLIEATQQVRALQEQVDEAWGKVKEVAIDAYEKGLIDKSNKYEWGSITITEHTDFKVDTNLLPAKFFKKVPDTTKIRNTYHLEGKPPKGTEPVKVLGFMKRVKGLED